MNTKIFNVSLRNCIAKSNNTEQNEDISVT